MNSTWLQILFGYFSPLTCTYSSSSQHQNIRFLKIKNSSNTSKICSWHFQAMLPHDITTQKWKRKFFLPLGFETYSPGTKSQCAIIENLAAVPYISSMGLMYWSGCFVGRKNRFYSIGVFWAFVCSYLVVGVDCLKVTKKPTQYTKIYIQ